MFDLDAVEREMEGGWCGGEKTLRKCDETGVATSKAAESEKQVRSEKDRGQQGSRRGRTEVRRGAHDNKQSQRGQQPKTACATSSSEGEHTWDRRTQQRGWLTRQQS